MLGRLSLGMAAGVVLAGILVACAPSPPPSAAVVVAAPTSVAAATEPPPPSPAPTTSPPTPLPTSSPSPLPTLSPTKPATFPTQPVQQLPMPVPRTPMPTSEGGAPRVVILPTPWRLMDDAAFGAQARADLAKRLKLAPDVIEVVSVTRGDVPIGVFNCAARRTPDKVPYTQPALVTAVEIVLRVGDRQYTYYAQGQRLITCDVP
ncbi:MAG: hypothetical protein U0822_25800 [Anaerolineae bacterium]